MKARHQLPVQDTEVLCACVIVGRYICKYRFWSVLISSRLDSFLLFSVFGLFGFGPCDALLRLVVDDRLPDYTPLFLEGATYMRPVSFGMAMRKDLGEGVVI